MALIQRQQLIECDRAEVPRPFSSDGSRTCPEAYVSAVAMIKLTKRISHLSPRLTWCDDISKRRVVNLNKQAADEILAKDRMRRINLFPI